MSPNYCKGRGRGKTFQRFEKGNSWELNHSNAFAKNLSLQMYLERPDHFRDRDIHISS